jgi:hypothetical protein
MDNYDIDFDDDLIEGKKGDKKKCDNFFFGFFLSVLMTFSMLVLLSKNFFSEELSLMQNLLNMYKGVQFPVLMIPSLFPSMFVFFYFYKTDKWRSGNGMVVAVLLSMVLIFTH